MNDDPNGTTFYMKWRFVQLLQWRNSDGVIDPFNDLFLTTQQFMNNAS